MTENDRVDELGVPLWFRLAQAMAGTSANYGVQPREHIPAHIIDMAKHAYRRLEQRGIVLTLAKEDSP